MGLGDIPEDEVEKYQNKEKERASNMEWEKVSTAGRMSQCKTKLGDIFTQIQR